MKKMHYYLLLMIAMLVLGGCTEMNQTKTSDTTINTSEQTEQSIASATAEEQTEDGFSTLENNNPTQERIDYLLDKAMYYYWHGGDLKENEREVFAGLTLKGDQEVREELLKQVIRLDPVTTDYRRSLASTKVINNKLDEAVAIFKSVVEQEPENYQALVQYYVYAGLLEGSFDETVYKKMETLNKAQTEKFKDGFERIEAVRKQEVPTAIKEYEENHLFILLGYALDDEGQM